MRSVFRLFCLPVRTDRKKGKFFMENSLCLPTDHTLSCISVSVDDKKSRYKPLWSSRTCLHYSSGSLMSNLKRSALICSVFRQEPLGGFEPKHSVCSFFIIMVLTLNKRLCNFMRKRSKQMWCHHHNVTFLGAKC